MNYYIANSSDHLEHHGVLGMKWGVRRYQNKDGSLTEAGMKKYGSVQNAHEEMRKKSIRRGILYFPMIYAGIANTALYGKEPAIKSAMRTGAAFIPGLIGSIGDMKYRKFLKYYSEELGIDPKKHYIRGTV